MNTKMKFNNRKFCLISCDKSDKTEREIVFQGLNFNTKYVCLIFIIWRIFYLIFYNHKYEFKKKNDLIKLVIHLFSLIIIILIISVITLEH